MYNLNRSDFVALNITDAYSIHRVVYDLFPKKENEQRNFLFVDKGGTWQQRKILILSKDEPGSPEFGELQSKKVTDEFLLFDSYGFEVVLNPTKRESGSKKVLPVLGTDALKMWFQRKSEESGFSIDENRLQISKTGVIAFNKDNAQCTFNTATFMGVLNVVDREKFIECFKNGIGRGKGFGFGLLQLVPIGKNA